jgi:hypothetical protein
MKAEEVLSTLHDAIGNLLTELRKKEALEQNT